MSRSLGSLGGPAAVRRRFHENAERYALYVTRFAEGFGLITVLTLLPTYVNLFSPSGIVVGLFTAALTIAQTAAVVPLAWAGDRYDKRRVLLGGLALSALLYVGFALVANSAGLIGARAVQGVAVTATSLMALAMIGQVVTRESRAAAIGSANAARLLAGIVGALSAGYLYDFAGFELAYSVVVALVLLSLAGVIAYVPADETRVEGFPFSDLAVNRRILTVSSFRAQYAFAVTIVRTWVPIYAGVSAASGGLGYAAFVVSVVLVAEQLANMVCQPFTGRLSDTRGRALFVFGGGASYGLVAVAVPFSPAIGAALGAPSTVPILGEVSAAFLPLVAMNALLGVTDAFREPASMALFADEGSADGGIASSFGIRELVWRPGSVLGPLLAGVLMDLEMAWVFYAGGAFAITGAFTMLAILWRSHGIRALREW